MVQPPTRCTILGYLFVFVTARPQRPREGVPFNRGPSPAVFSPIGVPLNSSSFPAVPSTSGSLFNTSPSPVMPSSVSITSPTSNYYISPDTVQTNPQMQIHRQDNDWESPLTSPLTSQIPNLQINAQANSQRNPQASPRASPQPSPSGGPSTRPSTGSCLSAGQEPTAPSSDLSTTATSWINFHRCNHSDTAPVIWDQQLADGAGKCSAACKPGSGFAPHCMTE